VEWVLVTPESAPRMEPVLPDLRVLEPELGSLFRWRAGEAEAVLERCAGGWNRSEERPGRDLARCPGCELADQVPLLVELALFLLTYASAAWR